MDCVFCKIVRKEAPALIVYEDKNYVAFLDKYPRSRGHLQLIPKIHCSWVYEIPDIGLFFSTAGAMIHAIIPALGADHVTLATFGHEISHAHLWIVPEYAGSGRTILERGGQEREGQEALAELLRKALSKEVSV